MTLAADVPVENIENWGKISLPEYLDFNRTGAGWINNVTAWHITPKENLASIFKNGLRATSASSWMSRGVERPSAVYMFCARSVVEANIPVLFGNSGDYAVVEIIIPAEHAGKIYPDNIYNISIDEAEMTAIQYRDNIPAEWIKADQCTH